MNRRSFALFTAVLALTALCACTGSNAVNQSSGGDNFTFTSGTALGKLYPQAGRRQPHDFTADSLSGGKYHLAATKGKVVVLNYWATWCTPCKTETPQFDLLYRKIHSRGVDFVGIDTKDSRGSAQSFVKDNDISYPMVYDEQGATAIKLGNIPSASLPFTVLLDKQGKVAAVYVIRLSDQDLQKALDTLLAER
jgi:peroxiredoxin